MFACWDLSAPYQEDLTLADLLARPHEVWAARRVTEDGIASIYLDLAFPVDRLRLWLDPAHNYLVWKAVEADKNGTYECRVTGFRTAADGAAIPIRIEWQISLPRVLPVTQVTTLSGVLLNEPVPAEVFRLPGLAGLRCSDHILGEEYRLNADGERADKARPVDRNWWVLLLVSGVVLVGGLVVLAAFYRRRERS